MPQRAIGIDWSRSRYRWTQHYVHTAFPECLPDWCLQRSRRKSFRRLAGQTACSPVHVWVCLPLTFKQFVTSDPLTVIFVANLEPSSGLDVGVIFPLRNDALKIMLTRHAEE